MEPRVTGIITVYNGAKLLRRSVESALSQTRPLDELIVVDDGSTDNSGEVARSYGSAVRYVHQQNRGVAAARNTGVKEASGDWIAFLDHDDEWIQAKIESQLNAVKSVPSSSFCYCGYWFHSLDGTKYLRYRPVSDLWPAIRLQNFLPPSVVLVRRKDFLEIGGFDETLKRAEDWELFVRFLSKFPAVGVPEPLTNYYEMETSKSRTASLMLSNTLSFVERSLLVNLEGPSRMLWRRRVRSALYYRAAISARATGESGLPYLLQSLRQWPLPSIYPKRFLTLAIELLGRTSTS